MRNLGVSITLAMASLAALCGSAAAESSEGGAFSLRAYGARAWGMGGAFVVLANDESALDWNPAGLSHAGRVAGASYMQMVEGLSAGQSQLVFVMPVTGARLETGAAPHAAGAMLTNLSTDVAGGETYAENHLRLAYAFTPEPLVSFGLALAGFVSSSGVDGFDAWGTSVDFSGELSLSRHWALALVGRDLFSRYSFDDGHDYKKEPEYILGLARQSGRLAVEADVVRSYGDWTRISAGAETEYFFSHVALRGGVAWLSSGESRTIPSFGVSVRLDRLTVHYGASIDDEEALGNTHRVSLALRI